MNLFAAVIVIAGVAVAVMVLKKKKQSTEKNTATAPAAPPKPQQSSDKSQYSDIMDSLIKLNLLLRKDRELSDEIIRDIEGVIDDLAAITPAMMERYPGDALTYEIKKIGKNHLYKTVKEYLDLSSDSRKNQADIFHKTITSLHDVTKRSRDIVEKNETAEFKTMANFLAGKFS